MESLHFDEHGLGRNKDDNITLFRRVNSPEVDITIDLQPNATRKIAARTLFHGIDGVYGGNTPESLQMMKNSLPYLMSFELPEDTEINDLRHVNNARWAGRHALALINGLEPIPPQQLTIVRMTPPVSLMSKRYRHLSESEIIDPVWVITPPSLFTEAHKKIIK
jgi:hypothetical protein